MTCAGCANAVSKALAAVPGATDVNVNCMTKTASASGATPEQLIAAVNAAGYRARLKTKEAEPDHSRLELLKTAGIGVLQAAGERGLYAIGVDTNQNDLVPGAVDASDIKDVGKAIIEVFKTIKDGTYKPGVTLSYGLASGGVDIDMTAANPVLSQEIQDKVNAVRQDIIDGKIKVEIYKAE